MFNSTIPLRKVIPFPGHKMEVVRTCFRAYCECGWSSCAHWERSQAFSEWREHVISCGGELEPIEKARQREARERDRMLKKYEERHA